MPPIASTKVSQFIGRINSAESPISINCIITFGKESTAALELLLSKLILSSLREVIPNLPASSTQQSSANSEYLTIAQAANLANVDQSTIRKWMEDGRLPTYQPAKRVLRVRVAELHALMRQRPTSDTPPKQEVAVDDQADYLINQLSKTRPSNKNAGK